MGSTSQYIDRDTPTKDVFVAEIESGGTWKVEDTFRHRDRSTYTVLARHTADNTLHAFVVLTTRSIPQKWDYDVEITTKIMHETMGPYQAEASEEILDRLSPTADEHALQWRQKCYATLAKRAARPKLVPGMKVRFPTSYVLAGDVFEIVKWGRKIRFRDVADGKTYRINGYTKLDIEVVEEDELAAA